MCKFNNRTHEKNTIFLKKSGSTHQFLFLQNIVIDKKQSMRQNSRQTFLTCHMEIVIILIKCNNIYQM
jgi:hypothetical protein